MTRLDSRVSVHYNVGLGDDGGWRLFVIVDDDCPYKVGYLQNTRRLLKNKKIKNKNIPEVLETHISGTYPFLFPSAHVVSNPS